MAKKIILEPSEVWDYFQTNKARLRCAEHEIASNDEYGISIYLTDDTFEPEIVVEADGTEVYAETCISSEDCAITVRNIYDKYLTDEVVSVLSALADDESSEQEDAIFERETELDEAVMALIDTVTECGIYSDVLNDEKLLSDVKEHFLEYLYRKWDLPIRRPMFLEDEDGNEFYEEYPYDCMVFDDEDNPIYDN